MLKICVRQLIIASSLLIMLNCSKDPGVTKSPPNTVVTQETPKTDVEPSPQIPDASLHTEAPTSPEPSVDKTSTPTWQTIQAAGPGPIRSIVRRGDGKLLGPVASAQSIQLWRSSDEGAKWTFRGSITFDPTVEFGDPMMLALPNGKTIFCAYREHKNGLWQIKVSRSDDGGDSWVLDSRVVGPVEPFVGAPFLLLASNGDLQIYYDSELLAKEQGAPGHQWIAMQGRHGTSGAWDAYGVVVASRIPAQGALSREGMATVVSLGEDRLLLVTEGVQPFAEGQGFANEIHAVESMDGGRTWDQSLRRTVYRARLDTKTGRRYNAYVPFALQIGDGPVVVAFCTDENNSGAPDSPSADVRTRHCNVKYVQTTTDFETWSEPSPIWTGSDRNYTPGLFERSANDVIVTIDQLGSGMRIMNRSN
ncbi:MAG: exo-alpha-sialidase [Proteobacteria bacterium]|nr:MAG: exo-alpha-sialidase [Pseudomonadota bacterium]